MLYTKLLNCRHFLKIKRLQYQNLNIIIPCAGVARWNQDWKPGPYPRTEEERRAAAKKYNLIPEDYKPFPEVEGHGDYPDLEIVPAAARNPYETYDYPHLHKNYGEPMHVDFDSYGMDGINPEEKLPTTLWRMFLFQIAMLTTFAGIIWLGYVFPVELDVVPKQYPYLGVTHYTFEPADDDDNDDEISE